MSNKLTSTIPTRPNHAAGLAYPVPISLSIWLGSGWQNLELVMFGWIFGTFIAVTMIVGTVFGLYYRSDAIMPGVQTWGIELGGYSTAEAALLLRQRGQKPHVVLDTGETTLIVSPESLGIALDATGTAKEAYRQSRSPLTWRKIIRTGNSVTLSAIWVVDPNVAKTTLQALAPQLAITPLNAGLRVVNGHAESIPAVNGRALDVSTTIAWLTQNKDIVITEGRLPLMMMPVQPKITNVTVAVEQANRLLTRSNSIQGYDPITDEKLTWSITPEMWASWLSIEIDSKDSTKVNWLLNQAQIKTSLEKQLTDHRYLDWQALVSVITDIITNPIKPESRLRVYHYDQQHSVQAGETLSSIAKMYGVPYPWIEQANPEVNLLSVGQIVTIPSPDMLLPLPVVEGKRIVISISEQKMRVYENEELKWDWLASTGIDSSPTLPGIFQIQTHEENAYAENWNLWMPYFMGIYRPVPTSDFMNGIHGFPSRNGSQILWTNNLGQRITYGCILISTENATALYDWAEVGVVVEIQP